MRPIDADALPIKFDGHTVSVWEKDLVAAPTLDVAPIVHAEWIDDGFTDISSGLPVYSCSNCLMDFSCKYINVYKYCFNCGAKMKLKENNYATN